MNPLNGLLLVDKPVGITSHDVVYRARRILGLRAIGHAGTLDPLASGLLVLLLGEATKVSDYLLNENKAYQFKVRLGLRTDSMDITGKVIDETEVDLPPERIFQAVSALSGVLTLEVPVHSAVKVDGQKLYELAHRGEKPDFVPSREMNFYDVRVGEMTGNSVVVNLQCSKGSFVRAWANRLGDDLGVGGCVETLRRVGSNPFSVEDAIGLDQLETVWNARSQRDGREIGSAWIPLTESLPHFRRIEVAGQDERLLKNGQISNALKMQLLPFVPASSEARPPPVRVIARESNDLLALLIAEQGEFYKIKRVFLRA